VAQSTQIDISDSEEDGEGSRDIARAATTKTTVSAVAVAKPKSVRTPTALERHQEAIARLKAEIAEAERKKASRVGAWLRRGVIANPRCDFPFHFYCRL
jgi:hypothetical protein